MKYLFASAPRDASRNANVNQISFFPTLNIYIYAPNHYIHLSLSLPNCPSPHAKTPKLLQRRPALSPIKLSPIPRELYTPARFSIFRALPTDRLRGLKLRVGFARARATHIWRITRPAAVPGKKIEGPDANRIDSSFVVAAAALVRFFFTRAFFGSSFRIYWLFRE